MATSYLYAKINIQLKINEIHKIIQIFRKNMEKIDEEGKGS